MHSLVKQKLLFLFARPEVVERELRMYRVREKATDKKLNFVILLLGLRNNGRERKQAQKRTLELYFF